MIKKIFQRIISDYFLLNRIKHYDYFIKYALENGYKIIKHSNFYKNVESLKISGDKIMLIRHDIDTDPNYCKYWLKIDKKYNINTSYYFRLCTFHSEIMKEINNLGSDCGYHFEEIADYAKNYNILDREEVKKNFNKIGELFSKNIKNLEKNLNFKIKSIASHGDFANKKLNLVNYEFINDNILKNNGLEFECYQNEFVSNYSVNVSDCEYPYYFKNRYTPINAIDDQLQIIHVLLHPRSWRSNWKWNTYENLKRLIQGIKYR